MKAGNLKKINIQMITRRVKDAGLEISSEMIIRSFKKCCISNAMDGSEDHFVYDEDDSIDCASDAKTDHKHNLLRARRGSCPLNNFKNEQITTN